MRKLGQHGGKPPGRRRSRPSSLRAAGSFFQTVSGANERIDDLPIAWRLLDFGRIERFR